jgi:tetratricopeptide (TPR) repeat protein
MGFTPNFPAKNDHFMKIHKSNILITIAVPIIYFVVGFLIYSNVIDSQWVFDDFHTIVNNEEIRDVDNYLEFDTWKPGLQNRSVSFFTFALNYQLGGLDPTGYQIFNILIHIINSILVFLIVLLLIKSAKKNIALKVYFTAAFVGLIFLVHPIQTQAVSYIVQRMTSLSVMFLFAGFLTYIIARLNFSSDTKKYIPLILISFILFILSFYSKQIGAISVIVLLIFESIFASELKLKNWRIYSVTYLTISLLAFILVLFLFGIPSATDKISSMKYLFTQFSILPNYLQLIFFPINQNIDHDIEIQNSLLNFMSVFGALLLLIIFWLINLLRKMKQQIASVGLAIFVSGLIIESSIFPIEDLMFEHRMYLPIFGLLLFLAGISIEYLKESSINKFFIGILIVSIVLSMVSYKRNTVWQDGITLWTDAVSKSPDKARCYYERGSEYVRQENYQLANIDFTKAISLNPNYSEAFNNRGYIRFVQKDYKNAINDFNLALRYSPNYVDALINRMESYIALGMNDKALQDLKFLIDGRAINEKDHLKLGEIFTRMKEYSRAIGQYQATLQKDPNNYLINYQLGLVFKELQDYGNALAQLNQSISKNKNFADAFIQLGAVFYLVNNYTESIRNYSEAIKLDEMNGSLYYNRAVNYLIINEIVKARNDALKAEELGYNLSKEQKDAFGL